MTHFLAIGHSHLAAMRRAYQAREGEGRLGAVTARFVNLRLEQYQPPLTDEGELSPSIRKEFDDPTLDAVVVALGGNLHNILGLVNHPQKFDFVLPSRRDLPLTPGADILPLGAMRERLTWPMQEQIDQLRAIRRTTSLPAFLFEPPPPVPSEDFLRANAGAFEERIAEFGVSPAPMRYKLWLLQSEILREWCEEFGIEFLGVPPTMLDADGMLAEPGWYDDPTHASAEFGDHQYQQLEALDARFRSAKGATA